MKCPVCHPLTHKFKKKEKKEIKKTHLHKYPFCSPTGA
jgi:hypothetical protein